MPLPTIIPAKPPKMRKPRERIAPAVAPLVLVAASADFVDDVPTVTMQFDRAIDVAGMSVASVQVGTFVTGALYAGFGSPTLTDARTVVLSLEGVGSYAGPGTQLNAAAGNGIVAADDAAAWAGVGGLALPFG